jgi:hypothetical protein
MLQSVRPLMVALLFPFDSLIALHLFPSTTHLTLAQPAEL